MGGFEDAIAEVMGHDTGGGVVGASAFASRRRWRPRNIQLRTRAFVLLMVSDMIAITGGFSVVAALRGIVMPNETWLTLLLALVPVYVGTALISHAFSAANLRHAVDAVRTSLQAFTVAFGAIMLAAFFLKSGDDLPRLTVGAGFLLSGVFLVAGRFLLVRNMTRLIGGNPFSIVMICDGVHARTRGATIVIFASQLDIDPERHDPAMYDRLATALQSADRVVVSCPTDRRAAWAHLLKGANVQSEIVVPELLEFAPLGVGVHDGEPTLVVANSPLGLVDRALKRAFDFIAALAGIIIFSPVMLGVAVAVRFDSPGPILFRQIRIGRGNQLFEMLKFRSMRDSDHSGHRSTSRDDDRITRVGRLIRSTSIDELPQLFNVLAGSMSIVGPRPHALGSRAEDKLFWDIDGRYWHRHAIKPGLTGLAQVRGYRGATMVEDDLRKRLQADLEYLEDWSLWRDLTIIAATARVLLHRNAF